MTISRSSDLKQHDKWERISFHSQTLPSPFDFGEETPYPIIYSCWSDPSVGEQFVFSTYDGANVKHWVAIGVDKDNGNLYAWQPDGSYRQIVFADTLNREEFITATSSGGSVIIDVVDGVIPMFDSVLFVDIHTEDENSVYSFGTPALSVDKKTITVPIRQLQFSFVNVSGSDVIGNTTMSSPASPVKVRCKVTGIRYTS